MPSENDVITIVTSIIGIWFGLQVLGCNYKYHEQIYWQKRAQHFAEFVYRFSLEPVDVLEKACELNLLSIDCLFDLEEDDEVNDLLN